MRPSLFALLLILPLLLQAQPDAEPMLLDVSLSIADQNMPDDDQQLDALGIYPPVRQAEARYLPAFLKLILVDSDRWGAVRLLPDADTGAELQIDSRIVQSDGATLQWEVIARDSTGREWINRLYQAGAVDTVSLNRTALAMDPFLGLFNEISRDLAGVLDGLSPAQLGEIRTVAMLKYAASLAPDTFSSYLQVNAEGRLAASRLPAGNDPILQRVNEIREHEFLFIDVVDQQYMDFLISIKPVYDLWRQYRREQMESAKTVISREQERGNDFRRGSYMSLRESYNNFRWAKMQSQYLEEISEGFSNEIRPTEIDLEDSLYHLSGTLEQQYDEWRGILREIFELESGF